MQVASYQSPRTSLRLLHSCQRPLRMRLNRDTQQPPALLSRTSGRHLQWTMQCPRHHSRSFGRPQLARCASATYACCSAVCIFGATHTAFTRFRNRRVPRITCQLSLALHLDLPAELGRHLARLSTSNRYLPRCPNSSLRASSNRETDSDNTPARICDLGDEASSVLPDRESRTGRWHEIYSQFIQRLSVYQAGRLRAANAKRGSGRQTGR